jgi:hypothetical protein
MFSIEIAGQEHELNITSCVDSFSGKSKILSFLINKDEF